MGHPSYSRRTLWERCGDAALKVPDGVLDLDGVIEHTLMVSDAKDSFGGSERNGIGTRKL
jgi:hypothetical protein